MPLNDMIALEIDPDAEELKDKFVGLCPHCATALATLGYIEECEKCEDQDTDVPRLFTLVDGHTWEDILALGVRYYTA
jgi:hypothetical protein